MVNLSFMRSAIIAAVALALAGPLSALERISLDPVEHAAASLTIDGANGSRTFSPAELEELGAMRLVARSPARYNRGTALPAGRTIWRNRSI
ncbi:MAG: hypothetical protein KJN93_10890 [Alphaproteobacteria bacterium]|nr:hypothetical protein [Alphaproteobacteria bacterium]NNF25084.1 hypothetical protein [Paracoccaceae bacterium]